MALAFSRVIDNSVISLENIYRHLELGEAPTVAAQVGGSEVTLAVLAATLVGVVASFRHNAGWCQQVSVFRSGAIFLPLAVHLLPGCYDRHPAFLFAIPEERAASASWGARRRDPT